MKHPPPIKALGPIARSVVQQRRAGALDKSARHPGVYALVLRAAAEADRTNIPFTAAMRKATDTAARATHEGTDYLDLDPA